jgi:hypothetical protein
MRNAERIVNVLLESDDVDPKSFTSRHSDTIYNTWEQVDGDVDWWEYGGTFHNLGQGQLVHIPGIEGAGLKDWSSWDITLTPEDEAALLAQFPVEIDPEFPEHGDDNERAREDAEEKLKDERAEQENANRQMPVYRWTDDYIEDYLERLDKTLTFAGMSYEEFDNLPLGGKWAALGQMLGYHEFDDSPDRYTWEELDKYLQPREDFRGKSRQQHHLPENP